MAVFKCKICGGDVQLDDNKTFGTCEYCGNSMTFPKIDDDQRVAAFNRGNHFRRIGEFDKALAVYERIVAEDNNDAEAHWCCALCRFGIEYVEDPATFEWLPTCHRASFDSFLEDVDYIAALEHSDGITKRQYEKDALKIAEVQKGIIATSQNTEPYDVFICYKESDENGNRTVDSTLAQDIYYQLDDKGYKVFFARITLEDVVGKQYEPYIFAALNSAKVMIVIGTKADYLNAVWVKNEWSRFIAMMKKDRSKLLIPCYRDMDPYDMPEQLTVLQSYDMSKIGFIQDLIRGISKVLDADKPAAPVATTVVQTVEASTGTVAPLLKRAFMFLEDGEWDNADEYCEKVLDIDPENAMGYIGKLMVEQKVNQQGELANCAEPFENSNYFKKAVRYADEKLANELNGYIEQIKNRNEINRFKSIYGDAEKALLGSKPQAYLDAADIFAFISGYKDAEERSKKCREDFKEYWYTRGARELENATCCVDIDRALMHFEKVRNYKDVEELNAKAVEIREQFFKEETYQAGLHNMKRQTAKDYTNAIVYFKKIKGYKDADELLKQCTILLEELNKAAEEKRQKAEAHRKAVIDAKIKADKRKKAVKITVLLSILAAIVAFVIILLTVIIPANKAKKYDEAAVYETNGEIAKAAIAFGKLGNYEDSLERSFELWDKVAKQSTFATGRLEYGTAVVAISENGEFLHSIDSSKFKDADFSDWKNLLSVGVSDEHVLALTEDHNIKIYCSITSSDSSLSCSCCKKVSKWKNIVQISAHGNSVFALQADGTVLGYNEDSGKIKVSWKDIIYIANSNKNAAGITADGKVQCISASTQFGDVKAEEEWNDIIDIDVSIYNIIGLKKDGSIVVDGNNTWKQKDAEKWTGVTNIGCNEKVLIGLTADGNVYSNQLIDSWLERLTDVVDFSATNNNNLGIAVFLKKDGTLVSQNGEDVYFTNVKLPQTLEQK